MQTQSRRTVARSLWRTSIGIVGILAVALVPLGATGPLSVPVAAASAACPALSGAGPLGSWSAQNTTSGTPGPTLSGTTSYGTGIVGNAFVLAGSGLSSTSVSTVTGGVSVMAWVKPSSMLSVQTVISRSTGPSFTGSNDVSHGYALRIGFPWGVEWEVDDPTARVPEVLRAQNFTAMDDGDWHHVAASWEPGSMAIFVDGVEVARQVSSSASINPADSTPFIIGGEHNTGFGFTGSIDEAMLFGRAITAGEIAGCIPPPMISTVAGNGAQGFAGDGGPATSANLNGPTGVAVDAAGNLYIADSGNHRIRKVTPAGTISTFAGNGTAGFAGDGGPATNANLNGPTGVAVDAAGNLYIADSGNHRIRKVTPAGTISTFAGNGTAGFAGDGGPATDARLNSANAVATDSAGNLYIADSDNYRVRKVDPAGRISTFAGNGIEGFAGDGGPATDARLTFMGGLAVDAAGNLYLSDTGNFRVRKVNSAGTISTFAGNGIEGVSGDGGPATAANVWAPFGLAVDSSGNLYIADRNGGNVRTVNTAGTISRFAGTSLGFGFSGDGGPALNATFAGVDGVAIDTDGNLYVTDRLNQRIRRVSG